MATRRSSEICRARYTAPMPPRPEHAQNFILRSFTKVRKRDLSRWIWDLERVEVHAECGRQLQLVPMRCIAGEPGLHLFKHHSALPSACIR
jgi:hypothetical protein